MLTRLDFIKNDCSLGYKINSIKNAINTTPFHIERSVLNLFDSRSFLRLALMGDSAGLLISGCGCRSWRSCL